MENLSIWDQKNRKFIKRGYKPARFTAEFDRTKNLKISDHSLAEVEFNSGYELNEERNLTVDRDIGKLTNSGFQYENVGNVFSPVPREMEADDNGEFEVLAHGEPIPGDLNGGKESCISQKMLCSSGNGSNKNCNPGKCVIGKIKKVSNYKWKYTSATTYGSEKVEYFLGGKEFLELKTIVRGNYKNLSGTELKIDSPASKSTLIYLPPVNYMQSYFASDYLKVFNYTYALGGNAPAEEIISAEEEFISLVLSLAYKDNNKLHLGPTLASYADYDVQEIVRLAIEDFIFKLDNVWKERIKTLLDARWTDRFANHETNRTFITYAFRELKKIFLQCIQVTKSNIKSSRIRFISDEYTRPIYLRLPAASLSYRPEEDTILIGSDEDRFNIPISSLEIGSIVSLSDRSRAYQFRPRVIYDAEERKRYEMSPIYSSRTKEELYSPKDPQSWGVLQEDRIPKAPVAKWLLAGADEFLREKKYDIETFYFKYLDPTECSVKNLDWLAQHVGLTEPFWSVDWEEKYKRTLIKNALGWFDRELSQTLGGEEYLTPKGEVLNEAPFNSAPWRNTENAADSDADIHEIDLSKIPSITYNSSDESVSNDWFFTTIKGARKNNFSAYKVDWDGMMESKGSILPLVFLFSLFGVKSHTASEMELINKTQMGTKIKGTFRVKSGLRAQEISAPVLLPTKFNQAQVGTSSDYADEVFVNQLVADRTSVSDEVESKNLIFRLPFYYNRDGKTWDLVESIAKYWTSGTLNSKVQYGYLAADLWRQGDAFFEPEIIDESIGD